MLPALSVLTADDIEALDLAADGEVIADLVEKLMDVLALVDEDITTIDNLMAYFTSNMDMDKILDIASLVIDRNLFPALHGLVETTLVNAGAKVAIESGMVDAVAEQTVEQLLLVQTLRSAIERCLVFFQICL